MYGSTFHSPLLLLILILLKLALGLEIIAKFRAAKRFAERQRLVASHRRPSKIIPFLDRAVLSLHPICPFEPEDPHVLEEYDDEEYAKYVDPPSRIDPDDGPELVWRATHRMSSCDEFANAALHRSLRMRGYVLWDKDRLERWDLLEEYQLPSTRSLRPPSHNTFDQVWERSLQRRAHIYLHGGRGWWSEDDESKVVYSDPAEAENVNSKDCHPIERMQRKECSILWNGQRTGR
jgi:hypothetical protein